MTALQIIGFIGCGIILIGAIFLAIEWFKIGIILLIIGAIAGVTGAIGHQVELDKATPTALDVYRGKRMREAQKEQEIISERLMYIRERKGTLTDKDFLDVASITDRVVDLESEVDEYLKKMEK